VIDISIDARSLDARMDRGMDAIVYREYSKGVYSHVHSHSGHELAEVRLPRLGHLAEMLCRDRYYNGDRTKKLTGFPLMLSSAVLATTESILLTTPLQLLKLRHMNTKFYVPFRTMLYECLFARPPTVVRPQCSGSGLRGWF
jgi:hypothetical protein